MEDVKTPLPRGERLAALLNRMERAYLALLRAGALAAATGLLIYAVWLGVTGLYQVSRSTKTVQEAPATVTTEEITSIDLKQARNGATKPDADPLHNARAYYQAFAKRYLALYRAKFEPFRQSDDAQIDAAAFDAAFVRTDAKLEAVGKGEIDFIKDKADLEALLKGMTAAAEAKVSQDRLRAYHNTRKTAVTRTVTETKTERYCSYYGYYIGECINWNTREVPVKRTVTETKLPEGVVTPIGLFSAYHEKFLTTLDAHRTENSARAENAREAILRDNAEGAQSLSTAVKLVGAFVVLMFLFLLIALERHQRRIARDDA